MKLSIEILLVSRASLFLLFYRIGMLRQGLLLLLIEAKTGLW